MSAKIGFNIFLQETADGALCYISDEQPRLSIFSFALLLQGWRDGKAATY
jgi:hypothetical protein